MVSVRIISLLHTFHDKQYPYTTIDIDSRSIFYHRAWKPRRRLTLNPFTIISIPVKHTENKCPRKLCTAVAVYTQNPSLNSNSSKRRVSQSKDTDPIASFNERLKKENRITKSTEKEAPNPEETERYIKLVKEQQHKGLQKLKKGELKGNNNNNNNNVSYAIDPETLVPGDYVVHKKVGIGRFVGVRYDTPNTSNGHSDAVKYVYIEYADGMAKLPARQAHRLLYRYDSPNETRKPRSLSKLSDTSVWEKRKKKGKIAIQKMVVDMTELYLQRLKQKRPPYPKDPAIAEFAAKFPYTPTPDQQQAFLDVEQDLTERETPMDRLICGDVGFGKTEVALRAIFYVVSAGKQAMVLAPTIVLAKQHYEVICDRYSDYPDIKVALLSRFQTNSEKAESFARIREGDLRIIVGTHSLLGSRVDYRNMGLLVIDEEQRFGVKQKEKIASFKTTVDVLTLSATPIPRTLYLALTGFRDASLITTPPPERVAIKTHLSEYSEEKVISAIRFELARGGQVFYVLPRIQGLDKVEEFLSLSFPDVEIGIAHGRQYSKVLEETMEKFAEGVIQILISTNIVESGLDIQNANTIIVQDSHLFGLAQMYQLRGRVGRADKQAHAYLFYPNKSRLSEVALERLRALEECHELGQGFQLAEKDMGIRGFGSIFGEQQSGDIANVGIDLYFEMFFESLSKVGQHRLMPVPYEDVELDVDVTTRLPYKYMDELGDPARIIEEAEAAARKDLRSLVQFTEKLRFQYGKEPPSMELLLKKIYVKRIAADLGISQILKAGKTIAMRTQMTKEAFKLFVEAMSPDSFCSSLTFEDNYIKAQLLLDLPNERLLHWLFDCLVDMHNCLPAFVKY